MQRRTVGQLVSVLIALTGVGCVSAPKDDGPHPAWPPPPAPARIIHRHTWQTNADFGGGNVFEGLGELLTGRVQQGLIRPSAVALGPDGDVYIADRDLQGIHVFTPGTRRSRFIAQVGEQMLLSPVDLAFCGQLLAVSDSGHNAVFLLRPDGRLAGRIDKPGGFGRPTGLAYDETAERLYVVDTEAAEVCGFDLEGRMRVHFGAPGSEPGQFNRPTHVTLDRQGRLLVVDSMNFRVQAFERDGRVLFTFGSQGDASGYFGVPKGIGVDSDGHIYVVDSYFCAVQIFDDDGRFLLSFGEPGNINGQMLVPTNLTVSNNDKIYLCDSENARVQVFEYLGGPDDEQVQQPQQ